MKAKQGREEKQGIPLQSVRIKGQVAGFYGEYRVQQVFANASTENLEVLYTFPLPERAAVTGFTAVMGGRTVRAEIREKEAAYRVYEEALRLGDSAFLLEQHRANVFQIALGQIRPGETIEADITYLEGLQCQDNELRLTIPTVVAPRYIPGQPAGKRLGMGTTEPTDRVPDADFITPPVGVAGYNLELDLSIRQALRVEVITSPSHSIRVEALANQESRVSLRGDLNLLDRDIVISCLLDTEQSAGGIAWIGEAGEGILQVNLLPDLGAGEGQVPREYLFLLDISGSMSGEKLAQAKTALNLCLRNLDDGDSFNILAFESRCHYFTAGGSEKFNQANLTRATAWINKLKPLGGTEILPALEYAIRDRGTGEKAVFLFTDGQVGNEEEIFAQVRQNGRRAKIFPFGIDTAVNGSFINGLAVEGGGVAEFIYPGERIDEKVVRQFNRVTSPTIRDPRLDWDGLAVSEVYPPTLPCLYDLEPVPVLARFRGELSGTVTLQGVVNGVPYQQSLDLRTVERTVNGLLLEAWLAKQKLTVLEAGLIGGNPRRETALQAEIVSLSRQWGILSSQTSFVAVEERADKAIGLPRTVVVPVMPPAGWDMFDQNTMTSDLIGRNSLMSFALASMNDMDSSQSDDLAIPTFLRRRGGSNFNRINETDALYAGAKQVSPVDDGLRRLALTQEADGSFPGQDGGPGKAESTARAVIAFTLSEGDMGGFRRQIQKAIVYLVAEFDQVKSALPARDKARLTMLTALALKTALDRGIGRQNPGVVTRLARLRVEIPALDEYREARAGVLEVLAAVPAERDQVVTLLACLTGSNGI